MALKDRAMVDHRRLAELKDLPIEVLPIPSKHEHSRTTGALKRQGIRTVGSLCAADRKSLSQGRDFGIRALQAVEDALVTLGIFAPPDATPFWE